MSAPVEVKVGSYADWTVLCDHLGKVEGVCELCEQDAALGIYDP